MTSSGGEETVRALICGDVRGDFMTLASNLSTVVQRQGPFHFALCCGNFLGDGTPIDPSQVMNLSSPSGLTRSATTGCEELVEESPSSQPPSPQPPSLHSSQPFPCSENDQVSRLIKNDLPSLPSGAPLVTSSPPTYSSASVSSSCSAHSFSSSSSSSLPFQAAVLRNEDFILGRADFPIPVFFIDSSVSLLGEHFRLQYPNGVRLSSTLEFLGGFGIRQLFGLKLVYLSGRYDPFTFFDEAEDEESVEIPEMVTVENTDRIVSHQQYADQKSGPLLSTPQLCADPRSSAIHEEGHPCSGAEGQTAVDGTLETDGNTLQDARRSEGDVAGRSEGERIKTGTSALPSPADHLGSQISGKQYFGGLYSTFYCRSMLQKFKELGVSDIGKIDIFLTCEWPAGLDESLNIEQKQEFIKLLDLGQQEDIKDVNDRAAIDVSVGATSPAVSELVEMFEPRYHIAAGCGLFYQRPIYKTSEKGLASRFIGLGRLASAPRVASEKRLKYLHALILKPVSVLPEQTLLAVPASSTPSPFFTLYNPRSSPSPPPPPPAPASPSSCSLPLSSYSSLDTYDLTRFKRARSDPPPPSSSHSLSSSFYPETPSTSSTTPTPRSIFAPPIEPPPIREGSGDGDFKRQRVEDPCFSLSPYSRLSLTGPLPVLPNSPFSHSPATPSSHAADALRKTKLATSAAGEQDSNSLHQQKSMNPPSQSVFVTNIPYEVDTDSFMEVMNSFGHILSHSVPKTPDGKLTGRAWITYETVISATQAVAASDQLESGGRLLKIQFTQSTQHFGGGASRSRHHSNDSFLDGAGYPSGRRVETATGAPKRISQAIDVRPHAACWFCLGNPNCEQRLIVTIGEKIYVALAKGGLVHQHVLIIPVSHWPNYVFCPPDVGLELERYIDALRRCYRAQDMEVILYERYFPMKATTGMHMQIQVIPIPTTCASRSLEVFQSRAGRSGASLQLLPVNETITTLRRRIIDPVNQAYFYAELPGPNLGQVQRCLYVTPPPSDTQQQQRVLLPFNFGREASAALLDVLQRSDWKRCVEPDRVETRLALEMQKLFSAFQPSPPFPLKQ